MFHPLGRWLILLLLFVAPSIPVFGADDPPKADSHVLGEQLQPWLDALVGRRESYSMHVQSTIPIDGREQKIAIHAVRFDEQSFEVTLEHEQYAFSLRRSPEGIALALPKHGVVFVGRGQLSTKDHLQPKEIEKRILSPGSELTMYFQLAKNSTPQDLASVLLGFAKGAVRQGEQNWRIDDKINVSFPNSMAMTAKVDGVIVDAHFDASLPTQAAFDAWPGLRAEELTRDEMERQLTRGLRRAFEVMMPSKMLTTPGKAERKVPNGQMRWIDGQRVVLLKGTPEEIGMAHGKLLKEESMRCIDSVLNMFGTVQTVANGRWFRQDLDRAYAQLKPFIPEDHRRETLALASSLNLDSGLVEAVNVFPELFHCSGFALFGKATVDGKLYHGRVLDYMTTIGLQDCATNFIVHVDGKIPFANVGYAGFIGSVSGMNVEKISLGEMGGRGEGKWNGVPMATLMRRALEESHSLEDVKRLWRDNPRTCEYYYVFADGEERSAVGVAATPEEVQFIAPGEAHSLLGDGIADAVVLSAGSRLEELRRRVQAQYGTIDAESAMQLMSRPVAMNSNLHNVLFVPEDGVLYVANANHEKPAADRPYVRLDLRELVAQLPVGGAKVVKLSDKQEFAAKDTLARGKEEAPDANACLAGLCWNPTSFQVHLENAESGRGDWLVRFPSAMPVGDARNDLVAMEWYQAKDAEGNPMKAPAAVVVHESGRGMAVGRLIAQALSRKGIHAFMIQLPFYGVRRNGNERPDGPQVVAAMRQGIADARRARDAVAALPGVDASRISLQGTSLGGFVTATTAGLDRGYHRVFILLAGGGLYDVLMAGKKDAAKMREEFERAGVDPSQMRTMLDSIEPLRLAHRIPPETTWMYSGKFDDVVPPSSSERLAKAANLPKSHHVELIADHYSGIILLPTIIQEMVEHMRE